MLGGSPDPFLQLQPHEFHADGEIGVDVPGLGNNKWLTDDDFMTVVHAAGKHRYHERAGVPRDPDRTGRQRRLAAKEFDRQAVLKEIVVGHEGCCLASPQRMDDPTHSARGRFDRGNTVAVPEMGDGVKEET